MFNKDIVNIIIKYCDYNSFLFDSSLIEKYLDKINWDYLCKNTNIPYTFFKKYLNKIDWYYLSENTNIPYTFFEKYLEDPRYKDKIDWYGLS